MSRPDHPLSLSIDDGVFGRIGIVAGFYLDKNECSAIPGDDVDFTALGTVGASHDPVAERADVINGQDLGTAAERQEAVEKQRKRHESTPVRRRPQRYTTAAIASEIVSTAKSACSSSMIRGGQRRIVD